MTTIRGLIYARVSTEEQKKGGTSIPKQLERDLAYNQAHGIETVGDRWYDLKQKRSVSEPNADCFADADGRPVPVYVDDFTGTVPIEERPEGGRAYPWLTSGKAHLLTVFSIDRLVRPKEDGDEWDIPILIRGLARAGKAIHTTKGGEIEPTFVGLLTAVIGGKAAGDERRTILERMHDGKRDKARKLGKWVGDSFAPLGYTKVGTRKEAHLEINPVEADLVRRIFNLYLGLNGETAIGMESIALLFNSEGVPVTGRYRQKADNPRSNHVWYASTVNDILSRRAYIGEFIWGGEVVTIPDLAIIPREIFDAVQGQRSANRIKAKRNVRYNYLLQGRIACTCDRKMTAINYPKDGKLYLYYKCNRKPYEMSADCENRRLTAELADQVAWNWLVNVFKNPEKLLGGLREYQARQREKAEPNRNRLAELPALIKECEAQARRLTKSLERVPEDDELSARTLEESLARISAAHKRYTAERDRIEAELAAVEVAEADIQQVLDWAGEIREAIDTDAISFEAKRRVFDRLNVTAQIEYQNGERGLRLDCPVLPYAAKWRALSAIGNSWPCAVDHAMASA
jgi:site-specific DNA recombinase